MKGNQKTLRSDLETAFERVEEALRRGRGTIPPYLEREWREKGVVFDRYRESSVGHGRYEERELWALFDPEVNRKAGITGSVGEAWPHLSQIVRLTRKRTLKGETTTETGYGIASLPPDEADAQTLLDSNRSYWKIENRLHWVRDVTFGEDHSQVRSGSAPQVKAALTNLTMTLLRRNGAKNLAAALRSFAARSNDAISLVLSAHFL